ncbi:NACHT domain-containing protein [Amycolatopsis sp. CA-126428]|uniref:NACHT domain-containing protein n=1 Tax=Amycolatopsis sp. CA-126428 TaxID=2073158 RepID=UPI0013049312|nr:NACHT domain-containing protein [Amycolatopsis sp. CA-126428]
MQTAANLSQLLAVAIAIPALLGGLLAWIRKSSKAVVVVTSDRIVEVQDVLAGLVSDQWSAELISRSTESPYPIPTRWTRFDQQGLGGRRGLNDEPEVNFLVQNDNIHVVAKKFRELPHGRLAVLGRSGAGKTTLAIQILSALLASRSKTEPVPIFLSIAEWDMRRFPKLNDWISLRLNQCYPALRATSLAGRAAQVMVQRGCVIPILDGLDEVPAASRKVVMEAINASLNRDSPLIVTCRTEEFIDIYQDDEGLLTSFSLIEPSPLSPRAVADYLKSCIPSRSQTRWTPVIEGLRSMSESASIISEVASNPLGLWLIRRVCIASDMSPEDLLDSKIFPTVDSLFQYLVERLIPLSLRGRVPAGKLTVAPFGRTRSYDIDQVESWLSFLAQYLESNNSKGRPSGGFAWWDLARSVMNARVFAVVCASICAICAFFSGGIICGAVEGRGFGLLGGMTLAISFAIAGGLVSSGWIIQEPGFAGFGGEKSLWQLAWFALRDTAIVSALLVPTVVVTGDVVRGLVLAFSVGVVFGTGSAMVRWIEFPTSSDMASTPILHWRADRLLNIVRVSIVSICCLTIFLIAATFGYLFILIFALAVAAAPVAGQIFGLRGGKHHASMAYMMAIRYLAWRRKLPVRLMPFLDDMHKAGILRSVGPIYQFRHVELQVHLARNRKQTDN